MTHTVVGLFSNRSEAQAAMQELVQAGFIQEDLDLSSRSTVDTDTSYSDTNTTTDNEGIGDKISNFFQFVVRRRNNGKQLYQRSL